MSQVTLYTTGWCPFCKRAEALLAAKGVRNIERVFIDAQPERRTEMIARTGRRSVPQIFIGDRHIGGYEDLVAVDREGHLQGLLAACGGTIG
ncbi:MAG: glutaredoxin 3 [Proteobacteria bacterium]|nr:glutaredoxin 3 [Pseudomonadota bacterium]MBS0462521.1 glutaredoxin 3 [Pseudomonadota bacterium]